MKKSSEKMKERLFGESFLQLYGKDTPFSHNLITLVKCRLGNYSTNMPYTVRVKKDMVCGIEQNGNIYQGHYDFGILCDGFNWVRVIGASSPSDFCYGQRYFDYDTFVFEVAMNVYLAFREMEGNYDLALSLSEDPLLEYLGTFGYYDELDNYIYYIMEGFELTEEYKERIVRLMVLMGAYLNCSIEDILFPKEWREELNSHFEVIVRESYERFGEAGYDVKADVYLDYFLSEMVSYLSDNKESQKVLLPLLFSVHFSYLQDEDGSTQVLMFYTSEVMKEYHDLRKEYAEHEKIKELDKIYEYLLDPLGVSEQADAYGIALGYEDKLLCINDFYGKEYVCAYAFMDRENDRMHIPKEFSMMCSYFYHEVERFKSQIKEETGETGY